MVPEVHAYRRAGLVVSGHVRQLERLAERLAAARRADAAGQVQLARNQVLPDAPAGGTHGLVTGDRGDVGHAGIHVDGADRVAHRLGLFDHLQVRLVVGQPARVGLLAGRIRTWTALVEQEFGEAEVRLLTGHAIQPDQRHLRDLVPRPRRPLAGPEGGDEEIGSLDGHVQQGALAGGEVMRDRRFEEMAQVVELVAVVALEHPALGAGPAMRVLRIDRAGGVEVAVGLLGGRDLRDQPINVGIEFRIRRDAQRIGRAFDHLVEVAFVERIAGRALVDVGLAAQHRGGAVKQRHAPGELALLEGRRDARGPVDLDARRPEHVAQVNGGERNRLDGIVRLALSKGSLAEGERM